MGMPITVAIVDTSSQKDIDGVFDYFQSIDNRFSTYKKDSEISRFNRGVLRRTQDFATLKKITRGLSKDMQTIFRLAEQTKQETQGYFDIKKSDGTIDPSGLVKGWAIFRAATLLEKKGFKNFYVDAGGDVQVNGHNEKGEKWRVGIKNPFNQKEIIKIVGLTTEGIATSGTYIRGQHVYNPHKSTDSLEEIISITVIGSNVYEADRFATACFAMQEKGIYFLEKKKGLEGYMIDKKGVATQTSGFEKYIC